MSLRVLVAGATGALGREVTRELLARGHRVRALVRRTPLPDDLNDRVDTHTADALRPRQLAGSCDGIDVVFSCLGASVSPRMSHGRRAFEQVDTPANLNLIDAATAAGTPRFVYVGVASHEHMAHLRYVRAHERVVEALRESPISCAILRPSGFFSAFAEFLALADKGAVPLIGDGTARTNPIDDRDLAVVCVDALDGQDADQTIGGPEVRTRREIAELAFRALGKPVRIRTVPPSAVRLVAPLVRPVNPRISDFMSFAVELFTHDLIAPARGSRTLAQFFDEVAPGLRAVNG